MFGQFLWDYEINTLFDHVFFFMAMFFMFAPQKHHKHFHKFQTSFYV